MLYLSIAFSQAISTPTIAMNKKPTKKQTPNDKSEVSILTILYNLMDEIFWDEVLGFVQAQLFLLFRQCHDNLTQIETLESYL